MFSTIGRYYASGSVLKVAEWVIINILLFHGIRKKGNVECEAHRFGI
jgi:hypothetical protein